MGENLCGECGEGGALVAEELEVEDEGGGVGDAVVNGEAG